MNLRRLRLRLTLLFGVASAVAVGVLAVLAAQSGAARIRAAAVAELQTRVAGLAATAHPAKPPTDEGDSWLVNPGNQKIIKLGDTGLEPPLQTIATQAVQDGSATSQESQDGTSYLLAARVGQDGEVAVAARYLDDVGRSVSGLRVRIGLIAGGIVVLTMAAGWWLAGRSLRPARRLLDRQIDFLADAAHQLRTPITVIQASASQALTRDRSPGEYTAALTEIRSAAQKAAAGVSQLLDLARLESDQMPLRTGPLRLDLLLEEIAAENRSAAAVVEVGACLPTVINGDDSLLRQAIGNAVENAVSRADTVRITLEQSGNDVVVQVADNGPGIPPELLPKIFDRYQGDGRSGAGLGLAIARSVVVAHRGDIQAANLPEGGAAIRLRLPLPR